jgi:hypothetical protein
MPRHVYLEAHWGIGADIHLQPDDHTNAVFSSTAAARIPDVPRGISWHSAAYFKDLADSWRVLYACDGQPVMVERPTGEGSLVLATDSFFISNEALKSQRLPQLLTRLIGRNRIVVLEETHHGILRQPGVIGYLRRHRLHWVLMALLTVAGLVVWQHSLPLVPPGRLASASRESSAVPARNVAQGLTNLLRRNISPGQLLSVCYAEWEKAYEKDGRFPAGKRERARRIADRKAAGASAKPDSVSGYRDISRILAEGIHHE